ncbi:hypothetical protein C8T65DRAFT_834268 [Cerioporus squamosus]|nr:hypothetical protein C8T65DRAFT_834268 [Cerioporus squamosus]
MSSPQNTVLPRNLNGLNFDTLLQIIAFIGRGDVASLTRTDKALRNALSSALLEGHVTVGWHHQESFRMFMEAKSTRTSSLRRLGLQFLTDESTLTRESVIESPHTQEELIRAMLEMLGRCSNLVTLSLTDIAAFGVSPETLRNTFGCLPQLEELRLDQVTQMYQDVLVGVLPNLRFLQLSFTSDSLLDPKTDRETSDPLPFIRGHPSTLEKLTLREVCLTPSSQSFPNVRVLELSHVFVPDGIRTLVRLFPGIKELATRRFYLSNDAEDQLLLLTDPGSPDVQELVRSAQDEHMALPVHERTWPHLRRVTTGNASELYYLGVLCPTGVDHVALSDAKLSVDMMRAVLENLRPKSISCRPPSKSLWPIFHRSVDFILNPFLRWTAASRARDIVVRWPLELLRFWRIVMLVSILAKTLCSASSSVSSLLVQFTAPTVPVDSDKQIPDIREMYDDAFDVEGRGMRAWELKNGEWQELRASRGRQIWSSKIPTAPSFELIPRPANSS